MTTPKFYLQVSIQEELPEEDNFYITEIGPLLFESGKWKPMYHDKMPATEMDYTPTYWLKELSLSEVIIEFTKQYTGSDRFDYDYLEKDINKFLTEKGYITK